MTTTLSIVKHYMGKCKDLRSRSCASGLGWANVSRCKREPRMIKYTIFFVILAIVLFVLAWMVKKKS